MANKIQYSEMKQKAVCCGKIYVSDADITKFKCKNCGNNLVQTKLPYVYKVESVKK